MFKKKIKPKEEESPSKEEVFAKLNASADKTLHSLQQAYEAGLKAGMSEREEDQLIDLLKKVQHLRDKVREATSADPKKPASNAQ